MHHLPLMFHQLIVNYWLILNLQMPPIHQKRQLLLLLLHLLLRHVMLQLLLMLQQLQQLMMQGRKRRPHQWIQPCRKQCTADHLARTCRISLAMRLLRWLRRAIQQLQKLMPPLFSARNLIEAIEMMARNSISGVREVRGQTVQKIVRLV